MREEKPLGMEICCVANLLRREIDNGMGRFDLDDVSRRNGWIIDYIAHHAQQDVFQKDIERDFSLTRSNISKVVDLMVQKGLIVRSPVDYDARLKKLSLTPKAWEIHRQLEEHRRSFEKKLTAEFTGEELIQFREYLQRLRAVMGRKN